MDALKKNPKVLLACFSIYDGNVDTVKNVSRILDSDAIDCWCCCDGSFFDGSKNSKIKYVKAPKKNGLCLGTFRLTQIIKMRHWIKKERFDFVYFESVHVWNLFVMFGVRKVKFFSSIHDVKPHDDSHHSILDKIYKYILKKSDTVFVRSAFSLKEIKLTYPHYSNKIDMFPLAVRYDGFEPKKILTRKILFFGRIKKYKGIDTLFEIAKKCPQYSFLIYGKGDKDTEADLAKCSHLENVFIHNEFVSSLEVSSIFYDSDMVIFPYKTATQSGVVLDAYRFSRPVIAFNVGSMGEQILDGTTGFLVEKNNLDGFCESIAKIGRMNLSELNEMCKNAYSFGNEHYSYDSCANHLANVFKSKI
jgi:glycosyltransferase involved in cell wall biosynthesis